MRKSNAFFAFAASALVLLALMFLHAHWSVKGDAAEVGERKLIVAGLKLTDLALLTEARYVRHLSQADLHSAFQDHPLSFEHFPSGSLVSPPRTLLRGHEKLD